MKKYVIKKVFDVLTSDTTLSGAISHSEIGLDETAMANLPDSLYPALTVTSGVTDEELSDGAPNFVTIKQNVSILYGATQPFGFTMFTADDAVYDLEAMIKAALNLQDNRGLPTNDASVSPNNTWASIDRFYFGPTNIVAYNPVNKRVLSETVLFVEFQQERSRNGRFQTISWDDGN